MFGMSPKQAVDLWDTLTRAYHGYNSYGGDTAEIYGYTLGDWPPFMRAEGTFADEWKAEVAEQAAKNLEVVLDYFCYMYSDAVISIEEVKTHKSEPIYHRVHVRVEHGKDSDQSETENHQGQVQAARR